MNNMSLDYSSIMSINSINSSEFDFLDDNNKFKGKTSENKRSKIKTINNIFEKYNNNQNKNKKLHQEILQNEYNKLSQTKTTKDNTLTSENSIKSKKYDKYVNKKISDISFIEQKKENIAFKRLNPDLKFIGKIIYNYKINKNNNNKICSSINDINYLDMTNYKKRDDNLKFNDLRKYIIKIEKKIKDNEEILYQKNLNDFMKQIDNLIARFSFIIYIFILNKKLDPAKEIFLLMLKENMKYIDYIEKNIVEYYNIAKDFPKEAYQLLKIYSFFIKYSQFFNMNNYCNIFLGRYLEIIYFIYNIFKYKANIRGFNLETRNQINFWFSSVFHNISYYLIFNYFPMKLPINLNNNIINIYQDSDENNLSKEEKSLILKTFYNLSLFYYLNGQNDKALTNINEAQNMILNNEDYNFLKNNIFFPEKKKKDSLNLLYNNHLNLLMNNDDDGNRVSTATSISEFASFNNKRIQAKNNSNKLNEIEKINQTFSKDKINLEDVLLLINYSFESGLIKDRNSVKFNSKFQISPTNNSNSSKFKLNKKISVPKYYKNPILFKLELLMSEIELDKKNYTLAYDHIIKALYILIILKINSNNDPDISMKVNKEQKMIDKYLALIKKLKNKEIGNMEDKSEEEKSENISNKSMTSNDTEKTESYQKKYKQEVGDIIIDKYSLNLELNKDRDNDEEKEKEKSSNEFLFCQKKEVDYKIFQDLEKFFIFLCSLSLYQLSVLNDTQPDNEKRNDLPILFSSQFKDCLSINQRIELDKIQTMALNRCIILKEPNNYIVPNNLNIDIINQRKMDNYIKRRTTKFINVQNDDNFKDVQIRQTREYKIYQRIIRSKYCNKEIRSFINKNFDLVLIVLKKIDDNEIENIINTPKIIIKPVKEYKKKRKQYLEKHKEKRSSFQLYNNSNFGFDNKNRCLRMSVSGLGMFKTKIKLEKYLDLKKEIIKYDADDFSKRLSSKKYKRNKSKLGQSLYKQLYEKQPKKIEDNKDYNDDYKDIQLSVDSSNNSEDDK